MKEFWKKIIWSEKWISWPRLTLGPNILPVDQQDGRGGKQMNQPAPFDLRRELSMAAPLIEFS